MTDNAHDLNVTLNLDNEEIAQLICDNVHDQNDLIAIIMRIDQLVEDWDFTLTLAANFEKLRLEFLEEFPESDEDEATVRGLVDEAVSDA